MIARIAVGALTLAMPAATMAQTLEKRVVTAGVAARLAVFSYIPDKCLARGRTRVAAKLPPRFGRLMIQADTPFDIERSNYSQCVGKPSIGTGIFYTGHTPGEDVLNIEVTYPDGHREAHVYQITIASVPVNAAPR